MPSSELAWCPLEDFASGEQLLKLVFKISGQLIKRQQLPKHFLERPVAARTVLHLPIALMNHREICPWYEGAPIEVIAEEKGLVAFHKPFGIHTHPQGYENKPSLVNWLALHRPTLLLINRAGVDRGCLWRLDEATSGLVLYAKTDEIYQRMRGDFQMLFRRKLYLAIVRGQPSDQRLIHTLAPFGPKGHQMRVSEQGERAELSFKTVASNGDYRLLLVELITGLRHQIRVQLAAIGHPLVGDELYGGESAERMYLHCWRYETMDASWEDNSAELFERLFDLHGLLQVIHNKIS